ncbi:glucosaminidase domain-containing protein [Lewinella sp. W8]|uniref:glucosaminidase domain-containing protein n=1 Tax=Lewinella sp. W8 TaxID=2528208 RepID=UPI001067F86F|nr:glucosaminidase domain-containing protein [Lewinella sp. W8]MTB53198.1 hypothetical protein [Lewinella sp. W8]
MTTVLHQLLGFALRHWLRLLIVGCALILLTKKQVNFNVRLGSPDSGPVPEKMAPASLNEEPSVLTDASPEASGGSLLDRLNVFGTKDELDPYELLTRTDEQQIEAFIRRFSNVAQAEQGKFGIPASVILANALLQSQAGTSGVATDYVNYFHLPCTTDWPGTRARAHNQCFRRYETAWTSFRDHSLYITQGDFARMRQFGETDYRRWAAGLQELKFNDNPKLAEQLVRTIDRWQLFRFD